MCFKLHSDQNFIIGLSKSKKGWKQRLWYNRKWFWSSIWSEVWGSLLNLFWYSDIASVIGKQLLGKQIFISIQQSIHIIKSTYRSQQLSYQNCINNIKNSQGQRREVQRMKMCRAAQNVKQWHLSAGLKPGQSTHIFHSALQQTCTSKGKTAPWKTNLNESI